MTPNEILTELFNKSPIPNKLKTPRRLFKAGKLGVAAKIRIIEEYTEYRCLTICVPPGEHVEMLVDLIKEKTRVAIMQMGKLKPFVG